MLRTPIAITLALAAAATGARSQSTQWTDLGSGTAGTAGVPQLVASNLRYGKPVWLRLSNAAPSSLVVFAVGLSRVDVFVPALGGVVVPNPELTLAATTDAAGNAELRLVIGDVCPPLAPAAEVFAQVLVFDAASPTGFAFSNAIGAPVRDNVPSDFNGDGYSDLAIGVPDEDVAGAVDAGLVAVVYGGVFGLTAAGNQRIRQGFDLNGPLLNVADPDEGFGSAIATGDFDGDGYDDIAIGVPRR